MPLINLGFNSKNGQMHRDLERILYADQHGTFSSYTGVRALRNSDVFTAVRIISADVASTKLKTRGHESNSIVDGILDLFNNYPSSDLTGWHFKFIIVANMLLNGSSYVEIIRDKNGFPESLYFLHNDLVGLEERDGQVIYQVSEDSNGDSVEMTPEDILHFRYITLDGFIGYSPIYSLDNEIGISQGSKGFLNNFFENGGTSTSILKYNNGKINDEQIKELKENFENSQLKQNGGLIALDETMSFERLQIPTEVLNFLNSYKFSTQQVAKAFGLPVSKLGIETVNTSLTQSNLDYLQTTLDPIFKMMIAEIESKILNSLKTGYELEFDASRLIDIDPTQKLERVRTLHNAGIVSTDEARDEFGYRPTENGEEPLADLNKVPLSKLQGGDNSGE
ncbi:MAG: phage portal protein [Tetragenococcus koreensis]|nr:phage portal protein [Tetragenococcus koreensis]